MGSGLDGFEANIETCKKDPSTKEITCGGVSESCLVKEDQHLGAVEYLRRPFQLHRSALALQRSFPQQVVHQAHE